MRPSSRTISETVSPPAFEAHRLEAAGRVERASGELERARRAVATLEEERRSRERYERLAERFQEAEKRRELARNHLRRAEERSLAATQALNEARAAAESRRAQVRLLEASSTADTDWHDRWSTAERRRADLDEQLAKLRTERESYRATLAQRRERENDRARTAAEIRTLVERKASRSARISELRERAAALPREREELDRRVRAEETARNEHERTAMEVVGLQRDLDHVRERLAEALRGAAERARLLGEISDLERKAAWLSGAFREALLTMEQRILAGAQRAFQRDLERFFRTLIDDPLLEARIDATFLPVVLINGAWTPADALSGGERTSLALAFRLALGRVVRTLGNLRLDTLILDEPTDGFSPEQVVRMGDLLEDLGLPQVILVSHEFELSSVADRVFETRKIDGISSIGGVRAESVGEPASLEPPRRRPRRSRSKD